jgi:hypothetical protein
MRPSVAGRMASLALASLLAAGCTPQHEVPEHPTWADAAPILRGQCGSCHGYTAGARVCPGFGAPDIDPNCRKWPGGERPGTGGGLRFDFYDVTPDVCGDAALALDPTLTLPGSAVVAGQIAGDVVPVAGASWARMPPQPSPALPDWQVETLARWAAAPTKGPAPEDNRPPTLAVSQFPARADRQLAFTAILDDPDGDSVLGVVEVGGLAFLMNRPGSFAVRLDATAWPAGTVHPVAVVCDGWTRATIDLGPVEIQH